MRLGSRASVGLEGPGYSSADCACLRHGSETWGRVLRLTSPVLEFARLKFW
jgi:hypothetical protein